MKEKSIKINAVLNVMKTVLSLVFPLITFPYITRVLQVNAIGKYDFSVSVISYFSLIAALGITTYAVREGTKYRGDQEKMNQFASEIFLSIFMQRSYRISCYFGTYVCRQAEEL